MNTEYLYDTYSKLGNGKFLYLKDIQTKENTIIDCSQKKDIDRNAFYSLIDGKLHKTEMIDGYLMSIINIKNIGDYTIKKSVYITEDCLHKKEEIVYIASRGIYNAHGKTLKEAISDVEFKYLKNQDLTEHIERIKEQGYITPNDYRLLTGACRFGTNRWLEENGFTWEDNKPIEEVLKLTRGQYGYSRLLEIYRNYFRD